MRDPAVAGGVIFLVADLHIVGDEFRCVSNTARLAKGTENFMGNYADYLLFPPRVPAQQLADDGNEDALPTNKALEASVIIERFIGNNTDVYSEYP